MRTLTKIKVAIFIVLIAIGIGLGYFLLKDVNVDVLNPMGQVAEKQRNLIVFTVALSLIVVVPVFVLLGVIGWKYRETNHKAKYTPNWSSSKSLEIIWWGIPCAIIAVLGYLTWTTSHDLDPYKALNSDTKPVRVQVVALQWKWLFIYPEEKIASTNLVQFPKNTPINFEITADAPMNSFWIPSLGGQVYAMTGMTTKLHLEADKTGDYNGSSANISGKGFSDMRFIARASTQSEYDTWVKEAKRNQVLTFDGYSELAKPGTARQTQYSLNDANLYDRIVMKYMQPMDTHSMHDHSTMSNMGEN